MANSALSPLDGRYSHKICDLTTIFTDRKLNEARILAELAWFKILIALPQIGRGTALTAEELEQLTALSEPLTDAAWEQLQQLEAVTNHDVKAIEYFIKQHLMAIPSLAPFIELVHFGCTSDDINNLSYAYLVAKMRSQTLLPTLKALIVQLSDFAKKFAAIPMPSHTHGQLATPTTFGKEMANFAYRLARQYRQLKTAPILAKFNGAVGNFNAHCAADITLDWQQLASQLITQLGFSVNPYTTQIEPHDWLAEFCHIIVRINTIAIDLCRDLWGYIALGYLKQQKSDQEVGSSTMPHKVNPIDFENAEGNLGVANALLQHFATKLPNSRWQRDLTDSTVLRNLGVAFGHSLLAYRSILRGCSKLLINAEQMAAELATHWELLAEPIQTIMRSCQIDHPYERLKELTRGAVLNQATIHSFITKLALPAKERDRLLQLTPQNYLGKASELAQEIDKFLEEYL